MKKQKTSRIRLNRETLVALTPDDLTGAKGGYLLKQTLSTAICDPSENNLICTSGKLY